MTLAREDANSKLFDICTVADVDADKIVDDSLEEIWKLQFGQHIDAVVWSYVFILNFCSDFEKRFWSIF